MTGPMIQSGTSVIDDLMQRLSTENIRKDPARAAFMLENIPVLYGESGPGGLEWISALNFGPLYAEIAAAYDNMAQAAKIGEPENSLYARLRDAYMEKSGMFTPDKPSSPEYI